MNKPATGSTVWGARGVDAAALPADPPPPRGRPDRSLVIAHDAADPRGQRVRLLRTELMLRHEDESLANAVALLSPQRGEGRSRLAAELAIACAQLGRPTLLVDADLHHPAQHALFGVARTHGLGDAIAGTHDPQPLEIDGLPALRLMPAGTPSGDPLQLLSDRRFEQLVERWRSTFAFVVVDTAAACSGADCLAVATLLGRILLLSRAGHTPYRDTREILRRVASTQARVLGAVVSHF